jgi:hypothetical protein
MMTNLHPTSTPTRGHESESKSQIANRNSKILWLLFLGASLLIGACLLVLHRSPFPPLPPVESSKSRFVGVQKSPAFLAQLSTPNASTFGTWLACAIAALSILALGKQFMRKTPLEAQFLTKREFQEFKDKDFADLRNRIEHSHESLSNKLDSINARLSEVGSLVARLDERTQLHAVHSPSTESTKS